MLGTRRPLKVRFVIFLHVLQETANYCVVSLHVFSYTLVKNSHTHLPATNPEDFLNALKINTLRLDCAHAYKFSTNPLAKDDSGVNLIFTTWS